MYKTASQVQGDIVSLLKSDAIASVINGGIYRDGYRPKDSELEDIVVIFTAGAPRQIQTGVVTVHIYLPDVKYGNAWVLDGARSAVLELAAMSWVERMNASKSDYLFTLQDTIMPIKAEGGIHQHVIAVSLEYQYFG